MQWKRSYLENRGLRNLSDEEVICRFKKIRGEEVSNSSTKKNLTMLQRYGKKSLTSEDTLKKGYKTYLQSQGVDVPNLTEEEIKKGYYERVAPNQLAGRGATPEERRESYQKAIAVKGKLQALQRGISIEGLSEQGLRALSGLTKRESFAKLTEEEKQSYRRCWKISHLRNYFGEQDWESETDESLRVWYHRYLFASGRLGTMKTLASARGRTGWCDTLWGRFFYRSSYEEKFLLWANESSIIHRVEGNLPGIRYSFEGHDHYYFPDFLVTAKDGHQTLVEIKARWMLSDSQTKAKIRAGQQEATARQIAWRVITEKELENLNDSFTSKTK